MFRIIVRSKEGRFLRGDAWYTRYVWVTWTIEQNLQSAIKIANKIGGKVIEIGEKFIHCSYPGVPDEIWF